MIIKKLDVQDIAKILITNDIKIEDHLPGERGELVQFFISHVNNLRMFIWGALTQSEELIGLLIAINNVVYPINDMVSILYFHTSHDYETNQELKLELNKWAKKQGAKGIRFICKDIKIFEKYGATQQAVIGGWKL